MAEERGSKSDVVAARGRLTDKGHVGVFSTLVVQYNLE